MILRVVQNHRVKGIGAYTVESKTFFWWKVLSKHWSYEKACDAAIAYIRGNGTTLCRVNTVPQTVKAFFRDY